MGLRVELIHLGAEFSDAVGKEAANFVRGRQWPGKRGNVAQQDEVLDGFEVHRAFLCSRKRTRQNEMPFWSERVGSLGLAHPSKV